MAGPTFHRVDLIAKYIMGLREQEKRIKCLESQASQQPTHCLFFLRWGHPSASMGTTTALY